MGAGNFNAELKYEKFIYSLDIDAEVWYCRSVMNEKFKNWNEWKDNLCFDSQVRDAAASDMKTVAKALDKAIDKITDKVMSDFGKRCGIEGDDDREDVRKAVQSEVSAAVHDWLYNNYLCIDE